MFEKKIFKTLLLGSVCFSTVAADSIQPQEMELVAWSSKPSPSEPPEHPPAPPEPKTDLRKYINGDLEFQIGWRQDRLVSRHHEPDEILFPSNVTLTDTVPMIQMNLNGRVNIYRYIYGRGHVGYGIATADHNHFVQKFYSIGGLVTERFNFHQGYGFDWLAAGGLNIPIYRSYVQIEPEMGYMYNKLNLKRSLAIVKAPYAGIRFLSAYKIGKHELSWNIFYSYLINPGRTQTTQHPNVFNPGTIITHPTAIGKGVHAYTISSGIAYKPLQHWSFSLDWYLFHANGTTISTEKNMLSMTHTQLKEWLSNQVVVAAKYIF